MVRVVGELTQTFTVENGVRGDALSTLLFNLSLDVALQKLNRSGHIGTKIVQLSAYADDIDIISRNAEELRRTMAIMDHCFKERGLKINVEKTKYMLVTKKENNTNCIKINDYTFDQVQEFTYLGSKLNSENNVGREIKQRITNGNRTYYMYSKLMTSKMLNRELKLKMYNTLTRPVVVYGCESWTLNSNDKHLLRIFERKILRRIYYPVCGNNGEWRIRTNRELEQLMKNEDIVRFIKSRRLAWMGHVLRMDESRIPRRIMEWKPVGRRNKGRPWKRWVDDVEMDIRTMNIRGWRRLAMDRADWKRVVTKAKTHTGL
ncbi:hypothetical protein C0J52_06854 [Blattella germanica]|nr:hypothetical protein C0J52_06854 [Blattella germanica]